MFKINYRITDSIVDLNNLTETEIDDGGYIEGYFELIVNDKSYEYCNQGVLEPGEEGMELITTWFEGLLGVLHKLQNGQTYVALSDIETNLVWIEFKRLNDKNIMVGVIEAEKANGTGQIVTSQIKEAIYSDWSNEVVTYDEMFQEVTNKIKEYLSEVNTINPKLVQGKRLKELKQLMLSLCDQKRPS